ncbi:MAG: nitrous oxide reductase family maturation protein NosD [Calditrichaeota bacterium]|nr:MAG: nitrous oxide reductase family maturation protein NosD [Calditrichota bacterium]
MRILRYVLFFILFIFLQSHSATYEIKSTHSKSDLKSSIINSKPHDTIIVHEGIYHETNIEVMHPLTIRGQGKAVIDGQGKDQIFKITSDSVTIENLTINGSGVSYIKDNAAILVEESKFCTVQNNILNDNFFAIYLSKSSNCIVKGNEITGNAISESSSGNGIHAWYCKNIEIYDNKVSNHRDGIYFEFVKNSQIKNNLSSGNLRYGLHFMFSDSCTYKMNTFKNNGAGVAVMYSKYVDMIENRFILNQGSSSYGLLLKEISDSKIINNSFKNNTVAIYIEASNRIQVDGNDIVENGWAMKVMSNSLDNFITRNNFISNSFQISTNGRNNNSTFSENYWSDYSGYDLDRDGYGDVPFRPVSLFAIEVEKRPQSIILLHSIFVNIISTVEKIIPTITPETLIDDKPAMDIIYDNN